MNYGTTRQFVCTVSFAKWTQPTVSQYQGLCFQGLFPNYFNTFEEMRWKPWIHHSVSTLELVRITRWWGTKTVMHCVNILCFFEPFHLAMKEGVFFTMVSCRKPSLFHFTLSCVKSFQIFSLTSYFIYHPVCFAAMQTSSSNPMSTSHGKFRTAQFRTRTFRCSQK